MGESPRFLDVAKWRAHKARTGEDLHVILDGEDVTTRCFRAIFYDGSLVRGDVWIYRLNDAGQRYVDHDTKAIATEMRTGDLQIIPGAPLS